jgi:succinate-semialdehyde dehydrogenase/glutarate-semialdehyde dehydrogenase
MNDRVISGNFGRPRKSHEAQTDAQVETALVLATSGLERWRGTSLAERAAVVRRAANIMRSRVESLIRSVTRTQSEQLARSHGEVLLCADIIDFHARSTEPHRVPQYRRSRLALAEAEAEADSTPYGVVVALQPWTFSSDQLARLAAPNLMAGNVLMVNHAQEVPDCAIGLEDLWREAGAPPGAYTNLRISPQQANRLIDDPRIKGVVQTSRVATDRPTERSAAPSRQRPVSLLVALWRSAFTKHPTP